MTPYEPVYVIWDDSTNNVVLYYMDNKGNKLKALFSSSILAKDAITFMVRNEGKLETDLHICAIEKLGKIQYE